MDSIRDWLISNWPWVSVIGLMWYANELHRKHSEAIQQLREQLWRLEHRTKHLKYLDDE